jgi:hypothetical protein
MFARKLIVRTETVLLVLLASFLMSASGWGCQSLAGAERFRSEALALRHTLEKETALWESRVASLPADHPLGPEAAASLARARQRLRAMDAAIGDLDQVIEEAANPSDTLTRTVGALAPLAPEPFHLPLILGAALIVTFARAAQLKRGMVSIARGIHKAMEEDPQFESTFRKHANTFRTIQTATARRVVDETTGRESTGFMIRLPV